MISRCIINIVIIVITIVYLYVSSTTWEQPENCYSLHYVAVENIVRDKEWVKKGIYEEFCRLPKFWFLRQSFRSVTQRTATYQNALNILHLPIFFMHPHQRQEMGAMLTNESRDLSRSAGFPTWWSMWLVHTFVNFMRQRQSHCLQVRQLNDLLSKGYSTCAFLSTNQAHAMPSDSSNNPNGNLVLNSISDTTILLMQNSDRFGWQGRNACF